MVVKKNSIALLTDAYTSPLLINTLTKEEVPVYAKSNRLKTELGIYCPNLILLDEYEAANIVAKPDSVLYTNSVEGFFAIEELFSIPMEIDVYDSLKDKLGLGILLSKAFADLGQRGVETGGGINEEYVCDAYFDANGEPVVLGIYAHPFLNENDFRDIVYYTSQDIMRKMLPQIEKSLSKLSDQMNLKNLPLNAKFKLKEKHLMPTEVNPGSFGSFSISDLLFFAFGINPYKQYFIGQKPDWEGLLPLAGDDIFFRVLGRLQSAVPAGTKPDHELFADTFENLVGYCKLDPERYPAFSIAFGRTGDLEHVNKYLRMDFQDYLT
jgi:hypothetical protein